MAVEVQRKAATDIIISDPKAWPKVLLQREIKTDATSSVVTFNKSGAMTRAFFGGDTYIDRGRHAGKYFLTSVDATRTHTMERKRLACTVERDEGGCPFDLRLERAAPRAGSRE